MAQTETKTVNPFRFSVEHDRSFGQILHEMGISVAITTYQAGKLVFLSGTEKHAIKQTPITFKKPMGIAILEDKMAVATLDEIQVLSHSEGLANSFPYSDQHYDKLYLPRATYYCGELDLHDLHFAKGGLWAINTRFSCLASFDITQSFTPRWKPPFISKLVPEDRCHLNGLATKDRTPTYVTALGKTDVKGGWREDIIRGGILMSVPKGDILLDNLGMPHSPRIYNDELYLLLSATGELVRCNLNQGSYEVVYKADRFIRGLAFHDGVAFIGFSKARKSSNTFNKLPVAEKSTSCGVLAIDLKSGTLLGDLTYQSTIDEIYDVQVVENTTNPGMITQLDDRHRKAITTKHGSFWKKEQDNQ